MLFHFLIYGHNDVFHYLNQFNAICIASFQLFEEKYVLRILNKKVVHRICWTYIISHFLSFRDKLYFLILFTVVKKVIRKNNFRAPTYNTPVILPLDGKNPVRPWKKNCFSSNSYSSEGILIFQNVYKHFCPMTFTVNNSLHLHFIPSLSTL